MNFLFVFDLTREEDYVEKQIDVVAVRLVKDGTIMSPKPITMPIDVVELLGEHMCELDREVVCVINLRSDGTPVNCNFVSMGAVDECVAHPREILKSCILTNAASMIMLHNHPSGKLNPSKWDTMITDRMLKVGELIGIPLRDHIIVGGDNHSYFSFREKGLMEFEHVKLEEDYLKIEKERFAVAEAGAEEIAAPIRRKRGR